MDDQERRIWAYEAALKVAVATQTLDSGWVEDVALRIDRFIASGRFDEIATSEPEAPKTW
jgi:hypothetical protein